MVSNYGNFSSIYFQDEDSIQQGLKQHESTKDMPANLLEKIAKTFANTELKPPVNLDKFKIDISFSESIKIQTALLACTVLKNNRTDQKEEINLPKLTFSDEGSLLQGLKQHEETKDMPVKLLEKIAKTFANSSVEEPLKLRKYKINIGLLDEINCRIALEACAVNKKAKTDHKHSTPSESSSLDGMSIGSASAGIGILTWPPKFQTEIQAGETGFIAQGPASSETESREYVYFSGIHPTNPAKIILFHDRVN